MGSIAIGTLVTIEVIATIVSLHRLGMFDKFKRTKQQPTNYKQEELKCIS